MTSRARVVALVPCYNGATTIERTVKSLLSVDAIDNVIVIDDGSHDDSAALAALAGAKVVQLSVNHGKGAALEQGILAAPNADVYLLVDADTKQTAKQALHLVPPVLRDEYDLTIGVLPASEGRGGFGIVKRIAALGIRLACGLDTKAPLSGQRCVRGELLRSITFAHRFGVEVSMTIDAVRHGARVEEIDVPMEHAHTGRSWSGFVHRGQQGRDVLLALWTRIAPFWLRLVAVALVFVFGATYFYVRSSQLSDTRGLQLPTVDTFTVVAVPYWSYDDISLNRQGLPKDTRIPSLNDRLDSVRQWRVASIATGNTTDVIQTLASGSREKSIPPSSDIRVVTERVANTAEDVRAARVLNAKLSGPVLYVGVDVPGKQQRLRPAILVGTPGDGGMLVSSSTHHTGVIDVRDAAPTALSMLGKPVPSTMTNEPLRAKNTTVMFSKLADADNAVKFYDKMKPKFIIAFCLIQLTVYFVAWARMRDGRQKRAVPDWVALAIAATPLCAYLVRWQLGLGSASFTGWVATFLLNLAVVTAVVTRRTPGATTPMRRVLGATILLFWIDAALGTPLQFVGIFGANPALGRYFGFGNPASMLLLSSAILWGALHIAHSTRQRFDLAQARTARVMAQVRVAAVLAISVLLIGMPGLGSDVGNLPVGLAILGGLIIVWREGRLRWKSMLRVLFAAVAALCAVAWLDYQRQPASRTHLGRLWADIMDSGFSGFWPIVVRKLESNFLSYGFPWNLALLALALLMLGQLIKGKWVSLLPLGSPLRAGVIATFCAGLLGFLLNDSGIVIVAMIAIYVGPCLLLEYRTVRAQEVATQENGGAS